MISVKIILPKVFRIVLDDGAILPDDNRHENRGLVLKENLQFYSCPEYIVLHYHGISTPALRFDQLS
jgi:hypothetical protein